VLAGAYIGYTTISKPKQKVRTLFYAHYIQQTTFWQWRGTCMKRRFKFLRTISFEFYRAARVVAVLNSDANQTFVSVCLHVN